MTSFGSIYFQINVFKKMLDVVTKLQKRCYNMVAARLHFDEMFFALYLSEGLWKNQISNSCGLGFFSYSEWAVFLHGRKENAQFSLLCGRFFVFLQQYLWQKISI